MSNRRRPRRPQLFHRNAIGRSTTSGCAKRRRRSIRRQAWVAYGVGSTFADFGAGGRDA